MKLTVRHLDIRSTNVVDTLIEARILALQPRLHIEEANVQLEYNGKISPPFRVGLHLVVPGPDIIAEGRDHTIRAAIDKVMAEVKRRIAGKALRRAETRRARAPVRNGRQARGGQSPLQPGMTRQ